MQGQRQKSLQTSRTFENREDGREHLLGGDRGLRRLALPLIGTLELAPPQALRWLLISCLLGLALFGCPSNATHLRPELAAPAQQHDAVALSDALEKLIDGQKATEADREAAYEAVKRWEERTAAYAFARAALAGRLAQVQGLSAIGLVAEAERYARLSRELDPLFREGAATRMLGTLYVLAPGSLVEHGDSETGLELLEKLVAEHPEQIENHLRVAEAYVALGDPEPAFESLCRCHAQRTALRPDAQRLLAEVIEDAGGMQELGCEDSASE